jgi:hypothetical protein
MPASSGEGCNDGAVLGNLNREFTNLKREFTRIGEVVGDATRGNVPGSRLFALRWSSHAVKRLPSRGPGHALVCPRIDRNNKEQPQMNPPSREAMAGKLQIDADENRCASPRLVLLVFICVNLRSSAVKFFAFYSYAFVSIRGCVCGLW